MAKKHTASSYTVPSEHPGKRTRIFVDGRNPDEEWQCDTCAKWYPSIEMSKLNFAQGGIETEKSVIERTRSLEARPSQVTDIVAWLVENTRLTRKSIAPTKMAMLAASLGSRRSRLSTPTA